MKLLLWEPKFRSPNDLSYHSHERIQLNVTVESVPRRRYVINEHSESVRKSSFIILMTNYGAITVTFADVNFFY